MEAIKQINDPNTILKYFDNVRYTRSIGAEAVQNLIEIGMNKISHQKTLMKLVKDDGDVNVNKAAVKRITDNQYLESVALDHLIQRVREEAVKKVENQEILQHIVYNDIGIGVRKEAAIRIIDPNILIDIAMTETNGSVVASTINNLNDYDQIMKIINRCEYDEKMEVPHLAKEAAVNKLLESNTELSNKYRFLDFIDQDYGFENIINNEKKGEEWNKIKLRAISKIKSISTLEELLENITDPILREEIERRIKIKKN